MSEAEETTEEKKKPERISIKDLTDEGAASKSKELRFTKRFTMTIHHEDGTVEEGEFNIKRPTIGEQGRIGVLMAELRQDKPLHSIDRNTATLHEAIATCSVVVTKAPPWWDPENAYDDEPLMRVFGEALAFFNSFRRSSMAK